MAGKSTMLRATAAACLLASCGLFAPRPVRSTQSRPYFFTCLMGLLNFSL